MPALDVREVTRVIEQIVFGGAGAFRTITPGRFSKGYYEGQPDSEAAKSSAGPVVKAQVKVGDSAPNTGRPPRSVGNLDIRDLVVQIRTVRGADVTRKLADEQRAKMYGDALTDGELLRGALEWNPNVAGQAGIIECRFLGTQLEQDQLDEGTANLVVALHSFTCVVEVSS